MKTPILTIHFNRPHYSKILIEKLKIVRPSVLYIGIDGPRSSRADEGRLVNSVKALFDQIDWPCEVRKNYYNENQGCKRAVQGHLKWFFEKESEGIVLEDDCFPDPTFFEYATELLARYRDNPQVASINGHSLGFQGARNQSYRFTPFMNMWGWATWRRTFQKIDNEMLMFKNHPDPEKLIGQLFERYDLKSDSRWTKYWTRQFLQTSQGQIDTWDYQWIFSVLANQGWSVSPSVNLIENVGWGSDATHTLDLNPFVAGLKSENMKFPLIAPENMDFDPGYEEHIKQAWCDLERFYKLFLKEPPEDIQQSAFRRFEKKIRGKMIKWSIRSRYGF